MNLSPAETVSNQTAVTHMDYWTRWFNVDSPSDDDGDNETVERIKHIYGNICESGFQIFSAQCRSEGTGDVFDKDSVPGNHSDNLDLGCTSEGLVCKNSAQILGPGQCDDYSIRFRCHNHEDIDSATNSFTKFDIRIYIILTIVPLILLLARLWWVYVYRRRKMKQGRNQTPDNVNSNNETLDDSSSDTSSLRKPPPSYKELFGKNRKVESCVYSISRETIFVCSRCQSVQCSIAMTTGKNCGVVSPTLSRQQDASNQERNQGTEYEGGEAMRGSRSDENGEIFVSMQLTQTHATPNESSNSVAIDIRQARSNFDRHSNYRYLQESQTEDPNSGEIENKITKQICQIPATVGHSQSSSSTSRNEMQPKNSNINWLLNPTWLKPSFVSQPCVCACHRKLPLQHQREGSFDHISTLSAQTGDRESNSSSSCPGMHVSMFDHTRVWIESPSSSSGDQSELPTYEDALVLTEIKASESELTSL